MPTFRLLLFDLSGVCFNNENRLFAAWYAKEFSYSPDEVWKAYLSHIVEPERGRMELKEFFSRFKEKFPSPLSADEFIAKAMGMKKGDDAMLSLIASLHKQYRTGYLTNTNRTFSEALGSLYDLTQYFYGGLASYQVGERKPHQKGFEMLLSKFSVAPAQTVFIDDSEKNLTTPREMGIATIHFTGIEAFRERLAALGISPGH